MQTDCFPDSPVEWGKKPLSHLAHVAPSYAVKNGQLCPFVEMAAVRENFGGIAGHEWRPMEGSGLARFKVNDTLFAKITPCPENGKIAFVESLPADTALGSTEFIVLSPKSGTNPRFLYHLVCAHAVRGRAVARMEGSTGRQRVPDEVFERRLLVSIPDSDEQAAIARVLDTLDLAIKRAREAESANRLVTASIIQTFFYSALGITAYADRPSRKLPSGWSLLNTECVLAGEPKNGVSPQAADQGRGVPTFSIAAVRHGRVDLDTDTNLKYADVPPKVAEKFKLTAGDVLIVRGNANPDLVGKAGMVSTFPNGCIYPDITKRITLRTSGDNIVLPGYFVLAWNHSVVHNQVLRRAKTSNGTLKINSRDVKQIVIPVPPVPRQEEVVGLVAAAGKVGDALRQKISGLEQLKKSLLHDLLSGAKRLDPKRILEAATE